MRNDKAMAMTLRLLSMLVLMPCALVSPVDARPLTAEEFQDAEAAACNRIPLGGAIRIRPVRAGDQLTVDVLANFGCHTTAGGAMGSLDGDVLTLAVRTILPPEPTPHCLCTRQLRFVLPPPESSARRVRYLQDSRPPVDADVEPLRP